MDSTTILVIASISGILILAFVLKVILFRIYDNVRNARVMRMNAQRPLEMSRLSDRNNTKNP